MAQAQPPSPNLSHGAAAPGRGEAGLALGALQFLEPDRAWLFHPVGVDPEYDADMRAANQQLDEIFDVSNFDYEISSPTILRGKFESLLRSVEEDFRIIALPFGPKIFAWAALATVIFDQQRDVGVWAFSSKEHAAMVDRAAEGPIVWHRCRVKQV